MECEKRGMLAVSMAGHDRGKVYVVWSETEDTVLLTDGDLRPLAKPKKKNKKHIQIIKKIRKRGSFHRISRSQMNRLNICSNVIGKKEKLQKKNEKFQEV